MGRLSYGADLLEELIKVCSEKNIQLGQVEALGAVQKARIGYYGQKSKKFRFHILDKPHEILSLVGNISLKDNKPMVHAHLTLADEKGKAFGGHLAPGTIVYACEYLIQSFEGAILKRELDEKTDLSLWQS
ncbi:MAG: DNA-binding protein [bacterium]